MAVDIFVSVKCCFTSAGLFGVFYMGMSDGKKHNCQC